MAYFPNRGDEPGNIVQSPFGGEDGDATIEGVFTANGLSHFNQDAHFHGNVLLDVGTFVDVHEGTVYTYSDPILRLNTTFTASHIEAAGVSIFRGDTLPDARFVFVESPDRSEYAWRAGLVGALHRILTIDDDVADRHALFWDVNRIRSHPNITFGASRIDASVPFLFDIPSGGAGSMIRYNAIIEKALSIERRAAGVFQDSLSFGFGDTAFDGELIIGPLVVGEKSIIFRVDDPIDPRYEFIFDGIAAIGLHAGGAALFRTDLDDLRIDSADTTSIGAGGLTSLEAKSNRVNILLPTYAAAVSAASIFSSTEVAGSSFRCTVPSSPVPVASATVSGITMTYSYSTPNVRRFVLSISYSFATGASENIVIWAPVSISLDAIRGVTGVVRRREGGSVVQVYGLPSNDLSLQAAFDLAAPLLASLGGSFLRVNTLRIVGTWEILATIDYAI